ncbi:hypothetical protein Droror1_Dr00005090 [Drosera rotundifolia]
MASSDHPRPPIRFGIIGCAVIANKLARAIALSPLSSLVAVASRSLSKSQSFASLNALPSTTKLYGSYDSLLDDAEIDAVYVPLPTSLHLEWAVKAARKGKHVLLEKPVALGVAELDVILGECEGNRVQFMDGTMWMHHDRTRRMEAFLRDKEKFGELKIVQSCFTFRANEDFLKNDIRVKPGLDGLGALGDVGWYCIRASLLAANYKLPKTVTALPGAITNEAGVLLSCGANLVWEDGAVATFNCSFLANMTMSFTVVGTKGTLHLDDFVIPIEERSASFTTSSETGFAELVRGWSPLPSEHKVMNDLPQEVQMVKEFSALVGNIKWGGAKPEKLWPTLSRKTQLVLDAVKASFDRGLEPVEVKA